MIRNTVLLVSDEAMPQDPSNEVPSRLLSLFTSPVIGNDNIVYPDFIGEHPLIENIGAFTRPVSGCTAFAFRADWQNVDTPLEIAYIRANDITRREGSLIGMYTENIPVYPAFVRSIFDSTVWEELPVLTHETFRFYLENLGMYATMQAIPYIGEKYNTKVHLSTAGFEEWCSIMAAEL